jgi:YVTN family beta-propeller protein
MMQRALQWVCLPAIAVAFAVGNPGESRALPAPGPLQFISPSPANESLVTASSILVKLDAACNFDTGTLAVSLNGTPIPASSFLPFSACTNNRITSQTVNATVTLPNGTIGSAPSQLSITNLASPPSANFSGSGNGDVLHWNFDGGAEPKTGSPASATFNAAGSFTVHLQATSGQGLDASGLAGGNLVTAQRSFDAGDPTPDSRVVQVSIDPDLDFRNFESGHTHPIALSAGGDQLYAVNTPEGQLSIFDVEGDGSLTLAASVAVGLDPVSLAVRPGSSEVWVANHLSDTVSIVDVATRAVVGTIAAGDEPTDVVFASGRAFVSLAGNQDRVKVYNASTRALLTTIDIFGDDPRALASNAAGTEVYLVVLESGNHSTTLFHELVADGGGPPSPNPPRAGGLGPAPAVGLIVQFNPATGDWEDETGDDWSNFVDFTMTDSDLFVIDADAATPSVIDTVSRVGTILFDVAPRPGSSEIWVPNTDARNLVRFEPNLRGHLVATRVSKVNPAGAGTVTPVDLNPHINYSVTPGSAGEISDSLAHPGDGVFNAAGTTYYLTAFGSGTVGVLNSSGSVTDLIEVGGGPSGVALHEGHARLYVLNRFENTISIVDTGTNAQVALTGVAGPSQFDPSPDVIKVGRKFLYDARITSGHGDTACATCHVFGNFDNLAWDLGDPQGSFVDYDDIPWETFGPLLGPSTQGFDPMKGPMTTQTLRGLEDLEPFHWRGDRQNFQHFNGAFVDLMGMDGLCEVTVQACDPETPCPSGQRCLGLSTSDMDAYTDFINTVRFPSNPFRNLNNTVPTSILVPDNVPPIGGPVSANPQTGQGDYSGVALDAGFFTCNNCHSLPTGTSTNLFNGSAEGESQDFKIPHLRNMYEKIGFDPLRPGLQSGNPDNVAAAVQKRGFGFLHDGSVSLSEFLAAGVFTSDPTQERNMFAFMMAFPTETPPCVGWQQTVTSANAGDSIVISTINGLINRAEAGDCDIIARGVLGGVAKGFAYDTVSNLMVPDSLLEMPVSQSTLRASVAGADVLTFGGVPAGAGVRYGIDRDRDTFLDRTETSLGYDPADPNDNPWRFN